DRIPKKTQKKGEVKPVQVLRSNLHAALMKAVHKAGIKAFAGKKIANLTQTEDDVTVTFEDGTVVVSDFVVGADGIHSKTRRLLFPDAPKPEAFATGYVGVLDIGTRPNGVVVDFEYPGGVYSDPLNSRLLFDAGDDWRPYTDLPKESAKLADLVASWGTNESVVTCIRYAKRITPANLYDLPNLSAFHKGRVVLVGDSAHGTVPFYGQGLNQAIEDAGVLSDLFGHFEDDYKKVFEVYDKIRVPRTRLCSASARKTAARMKASSKIDLKIGRFMMKLVFNILSLIGADDEVYFHDYRDDVKKAIPDIQFK
ncbi:hypothetical protein HDU99_002489, partial [Rhizoclosmatium hyalinum]